MKRKFKSNIPKICISVFFAIILCALSATAIFCYTQPMKNDSYDLSLIPDDGQPWEGNKNWEIFINEQGQKKELTPDKIGGYNGLEYLGQTFYFSRKMVEKLDCPTLHIDVANRNISVFLDDSLIYTDCPDSDNRIGYLNLPMLELDRTEPVIITLPNDYAGKTITIAQSTPLYSEKQEGTDTVYPCSVTLSCGYAYESEIIAETAQIMIPAVLLFSLVIFLLIAFIWSSTLGNMDFSMPALALAAMFQLCRILSQAPFFYHYFGKLSIDLTWLFFHLSIGALLVFFSIKFTKWRPLFTIITTFQWLSIGMYCLVQCTSIIEYGNLYLFFVNLPQQTGFLALIIILVSSYLQIKKRNKFITYFSTISIAIICAYVVFVIISLIFSAPYAQSVLERIGTDASNLIPNFSLKLIWNLCLLSASAAIILEMVEKETNRRTETAVLSARNKLADESYKNLYRSSEDVMMLKHDTMKHYNILYTMSNEHPEQISEYLEQLIGQIKEIRPVVESGNQTLNIIINSKVSIAVEKNINVEIIRSEAPKDLPLTQTQICSLFTNILDNAINAAATDNAEKPHITIDFHCKNNNFVFICENTMDASKCCLDSFSEDFENISELHHNNFNKSHGYGIKIIRRIMKNFDDMIYIETENNTFKITVIIPLE